MSSEIASDDGPLLAGDQVLLGGDLARLLGLDQLGNRTSGERGVGAGLVFAAVGRGDAGTCAEFGRDLDALAGGVQPRGGVGHGIWGRGSAHAWSTQLVCWSFATPARRAAALPRATPR